jgi:hypothetical protein
MYDVPRTALDIHLAAQIEASSWNTTERLIAAFTEESEPIAEPSVPPEREEEPLDEILPPCVPNVEEENDDLNVKLSEYREFINCALRNDAAGQRAYAKEQGEMMDSIADRINEIAADVIGDILLEEDENGGYRILADYAELWHETE